MISFDFYSNHYKVYIHLPWNNTHQQTIATFDINQVIPSSDRQSPRQYQRLADCCEGDCTSDIIILLHQSQTVHYCNQSVLVIVLDLNIFVWSITILISFWETPWYSSFILHASYLYNPMGMRFYIFGSLPVSRVCDCHCHRWVHCIVTTKIWF